MRARVLMVAALVAFLSALALPAGALAVGLVHDRDGELADFDTRTGSLAPTAGQRARVRGLDGQVAWNRFGTPSTLVKEGGGYLATGVAGTSAAAAARSWLDANRALFRLSSTSGLELHNDAPLARSDGHAVTFRQTFGDLPASDGGLVTIGLTQAGRSWSVASVSSTLTGDEALTGAAEVAPELAWQRAASSVGESHPLAEIDRVAVRGRAPDWRLLEVDGLQDVQRVRAVAFPTVSRGVLPAYEALVLDTEAADPLAYRVFVDARSRRVLARQSLVDHLHDGPPPVFTFTGELPPTDGACDERKGPYTVAPDAHVRAIDVFANAEQILQNIVVNLYVGDQRVARADRLNTPERIRYAPAGGVPPGEYFVEVCEFDDAADTAPLEPRGYRGTLTLDTTAAPAPYLARWRVFPANPPLAALPADPWNLASTDTRSQWCWRLGGDAEACSAAIGNLASRAPWDHDMATNLPSSTTIGNNAVTAESWTDASRPAPTQFRPVSAVRDYSFPWTNDWSERDCDPGDPYGSAFVPGESIDVSAAVTNLFAMHNRMHDWSYSLGFTEEAWNAQAHNFGLTESYRENDPLVGNAQAGATLPPPGVYGSARDNANMITLPEGQASVTNMYMWQPLAGGFYAPCVDGDYDMGVIGHEYTHMIENRMIGKGDRRTGHHAGAMGESHSDLLSVEQLNESGDVPTGGENPWAVGTYATGNQLRGIRNYAGNFAPTGAFPSPGRYDEVQPLNFSDVGYDLTGPQVHADGELWTATNFDIRKALAAKYEGAFPEGDARLQARCANGTLPPESCPGNRRWIQLVLDAFLLMPTAPSILDARNAILAADTMRFDGANQDELWLAFSRRGMGEGATSTNGTGRAAGVESDTDPTPDFASPRQAAAAVTFRTLASGAEAREVPARIFVGHYEGRVSPVADTDPGTDASNLDEEATFAPGTYEFVASAPGYGHVRFRQTFAAGADRTLTIRLAPNWASAGQGASAAGDAAPVTSPTSEPAGAEVLSAEQVLGRLIDDTEATNWQAAASEVEGGWSVAGRQVTVDLGGEQARAVRRVQVSAMLGPVFDPNARPNPGDLGQNRFTAVRQFELWSCNAARGDDCASDDGFRRLYTSAPDAFPGAAPRPVAPELILREFDVPDVRATHLRLVARTNQCEGGPEFQGEQDADPFNATDCDAAGPASTRLVRVAELQAFSGSGRVVSSEEE